MVPPAVPSSSVPLLAAARVAVDDKSEAAALPSGQGSGQQLQQWAGGKVFSLAGESHPAGMAEMGDAQAKHIHTAEKFERNVRKGWFLGGMNCGV